MFNVWKHLISVKCFFCSFEFVDNNQRGTFAEYLFATECLKRGFNVSFPLMDSSIYDCIIDTGDKLLKIQIKSTAKLPDRKNKKSIHVPLQNSRMGYTVKNVDYFAVWVNHFNGFFIFKNIGNMQSIRLSKTGKHKINFNNFAFE